MILGSGIDLIEVARVARALERFGARFEERVFAPAEIAEARRHTRPALHYALRFAAKEALMKAVGTGWAGGTRWVDIETQRTSAAHAGRWGLVLHGRVAERARELGATRVHVDASHAGGRVALACVLLEGAER